MPTTQTQIGDYQSLILEVQRYLNRNDTKTIEQIPVFINFAEKSIARKLRMPSLESFVEFTLPELEAVDPYSANTEEGWFKIPVDYLEMKSIYITDSFQATTLDRISIDDIIAPTNLTSPTGFGRIADRIYINGRPNNNKIRMVYYHDTPESGIDYTSIWYDLAPDVILYESVAEGFDYLYEADKAKYWRDKSSIAIQEIHDMVKKAEWSGGNKRINLGGCK